MRARAVLWIVAGLGAIACAPLQDADAVETVGGDPDGPGRHDAPDFAPPTAACALDPPDPRRLAITTTDFSSGALAIVDLATGTVTPDVAPTSSDALPVARDERLFVLHRFGLDRLDELDPEDFSLQNQIPIPATAGGRPNPHSLALAPDARAFVVLFGEPRIAILDPRAAPEAAHLGDVSLGALASGDDNPDASSTVACGERIYVVLEQVDEGFAPRGEDAIAVVDTTTGEILDADLSAPGVQGLRTLGTWLRQLRRDPADDAGTTLLGLSTGIERIDVRAGEVTWAVPASAFVAAGIDDFLLPQSFDVNADGSLAYVAAYDPDFGQVRLYRVGLDGAAPEVPEPFASGFDSVERTLEVTGDTLWYASSRVGAAGVLRFDLRVDPPRADGPARSTGLPPYAMTVLP